MQKKKNQKQSTTEAAHNFFVQFLRLGTFGFKVISRDKRTRVSEKNQYARNIQHRKDNADCEDDIQSDFFFHIFSIAVPHRQVNIPQD